MPKSCAFFSDFAVSLLVALAAGHIRMTNRGEQIKRPYGWSSPRRDAYDAVGYRF